MRTYFLFDLQKWWIDFYVLNTEEIRKSSTISLHVKYSLSSNGEKEPWVVTIQYDDSQWCEQVL